MKILYLLFAFLFLAFLSEPGDAQPRCLHRGGLCFPNRCPPRYVDLKQLDCSPQRKCCRRGIGK
ncbi:beta-defensin-like [Crotalus adamanteus]|uniref:Beta-defensin-like n=1 Tax=Crotalus adamanteus TaxID=8729 RepID=A0AAW1BT49_CROAD